MERPTTVYYMWIKKDDFFVEREEMVRTILVAVRLVSIVSIN